MRYPQSSQNRLTAKVFSAAALAVFFSTAAHAQTQRPVVQTTNAGTLMCDISAGLGLIVGSSRTMTCRFSPSRGRQEVYDGTIRRFGLDLGITAGTQLVWVVLSTGSNRRPGDLAGEYVGAAADASLGIGGGGSLLVGGSNRAISLQPLSVQAQAGVNVAAGVSQLVLNYRR